MESRRRLITQQNVSWKPIEEYYRSLYSRFGGARANAFAEFYGTLDTRTRAGITAAYSILLRSSLN
jgi:hypothetical protein